MATRYEAALFLLLACSASACVAAGPARPADAEAQPGNGRKEERDRMQMDAKALLSPTETVRAFSLAVQEKDVATVKRLLSQGSLVMLEGGASQKNLSVDEFIRSGDDMPFKVMPDIRNERMQGDLATVEVEYGGKWETVFFIKEEGVWKIAFDKG